MKRFRPLKNAQILRSQFLNIFLILGMLAFGLALCAFENEDKSAEEIAMQELLDYKSKWKRAYDRPDLAAKREFKMTKDPRIGRPTPEVLPAVLKKIKKENAEKISRSVTPSPGDTANPWEAKGPNNVGGRTRAILIDASDTSGNTVWAGSISGGIWKTTNFLDANCTWSPVNGAPSGLSVSAIVQDPSNPNILYASTGEPFTAIFSIEGTSSTAVGNGIWRSMDGGNSFELLSSTQGTTLANPFNFTFDMEIMSNGTILCGTIDGLYVSSDMGQNWNNVLPGDGNFWAGDIEITSNGQVLVAFYGAIYSLNMSNLTLTPILQGYYSRIEIASAPSNPNVIYALCSDGANNSNIGDLFRSDDGGANWFLINTPNNVPQQPDNSNQLDDFTRGQAYYDLIAKVSPTDPMTLYVGGINLYRSTDGGMSWGDCGSGFEQYNSCPLSIWWGNNDQNPYYVHADQHEIVFYPNDPSRAIFANDGGVHFSDNLNQAEPTFSEKNDGYIVTQYYSCAVNDFADEFIAGSQDNGTHYLAGDGMSDEIEIDGGDGAFCFFDTDDGFVITSYVYNTYTLISSDAYQPILADQNSGSFINPADYDPNVNVLVSAATDGIFITSNIGIGLTANTEFVATGYTPTIVKLDENQGAIFIGTEGTESDPSHIIRVGANGALDHFDGEALPSGYISAIDIDENNPNNMICSFSNYGIDNVFNSTDGGITWRAVSFEPVPVRWVEFHPTDSNKAVIATQLGIYECEDLSSSNPTWTDRNNGLGYVRVDMLDIRYADNLLVAGTHGRGLYTAAGFPAPSLPPYLNTDVINLNFAGAGGSESIEVFSDVEWEFVNKSAAWIIAPNPSTGENNDSRIISVTANPGLESRSGTIELAAADGSLASVTINITQDPTEDLILEANPGYLIFDRFGGDKLIEITANREWEVKLKQDDIEWLEFSPTNGGNNTVITVSVEEMPPFGINRYAELQIYPNTGDDIDTTTIIINQLMESASYLNATFTQASSTTGVLDINSDLKWKIENASHEWIKLGGLLEGEGDQFLNIDLDELESTQDSRNGEIIIVSDDSLMITRRVEVVQTRSFVGAQVIDQLAWPNPVVDVLHLKLMGMQDEDISLRLLKANGATVWEEQIRFWQEEYVQEIDFQNLSPGLYFLQTKVRDELKVEKIFKQ